MAVSNQDQGYSTANFTPITAPSQVAPTSTVSVDTGNAGGSVPATVSVPLGLITQASKVAPAVTAHAGGGQAAAFQLDYGVSNVTVVVTAADSVKLPAATVGAWCYIRNADSTDSVTVFGFGTDTIDSIASATGNAQAAGKGKLYFAVVGVGDGVAGNWVSLLGA